MKPALLIIDMQNDFVLPGSPARVDGAFATVRRVGELLNHFRSKGLPVFHIVREYRADGSDIEISRRDAFMKGTKYAVPGTDGVKIIEDLTPMDGEYKIVKQRFSAFLGTELDLVLRSLGIGRLVICGTQYPNCIRATAYDGLSYGYDTLVITDATSASTDEIAEANIRDMLNVGIQCMPFADYLREI